ncbi:hypothetical protein [Aristaeella hokkaidonensis]|uniref:hypothetical protein n=1 Tax=Aristaeella hokkaidonensis TaxID=3046382 RepID=UPI000B688BBE|nr:hypothetical protein [Aristaeella hokkaidonensis]SNT94244.1 hypothetical protein SAMN06297421_104218 [Aristaeella hokkaidonensis]
MHAGRIPEPGQVVIKQHKKQHKITYTILSFTMNITVFGFPFWIIIFSIGASIIETYDHNTSISTVYTSDCLVKVLVALKQLNAEKDNGGNGSGGSGGESGGSSTGGSSGGSDGGDNGGGSGGTDTAQNNDTRFTMSVKLDNTRVIRDLQKYLDEVISHLTSVDNCDVELSLEVNAHAENGFSQGTIRTVSENCRTLHVENFFFDR